MATDPAERAAAILERRLAGLAPSVAVILGSGLGGFTQAIDRPRTVPYRALPGFPRTSVDGHPGELFAGQIAGRHVIALAGRAHVYEALPLDAYRVPVRALRCQRVRDRVSPWHQPRVRRDLDRAVVDHAQRHHRDPGAAEPGDPGPALEQRGEIMGSDAHQGHGDR